MIGIHRFVVAIFRKALNHGSGWVSYLDLLPLSFLFFMGAGLGTAFCLKKTVPRHKRAGRIVGIAPAQVSEGVHIASLLSSVLASCQF